MDVKLSSPFNLDGYKVVVGYTTDEASNKPQYVSIVNDTIVAIGDLSPGQLKKVIKHINK